MKRTAASFAMTACMVVLMTPLHAQDIEDFVSAYTGANGEGYMQPLANSFTANLNSGFFQGADIPGSKIYVRGDLIGMVAFTADDAKTFQATTQDPFTPESTVVAPTVFGSANPVEVEGEGGTVFTFPGGLDIGKLPFLVPQISVGGFRGTEVSVRYFQLSLDDNFKDVKLFGFGARHNISQYLTDPPLDLAVGFFFQTFEVAGFIESNTTYFGLQASYTPPSAGILTLYGGPGIERSNLDISYALDDETSVSFEMDSDNSFRFTAGAAIDLRLLHLFVDYNFASQGALALGIGLGSSR